MAARPVRWISIVQSGRRKGFQREANAWSVRGGRCEEEKRQPSILPLRTRTVSVEKPWFIGISSTRAERVRAQRVRCRLSSGMNPKATLRQAQGKI